MDARLEWVKMTNPFGGGAEEEDYSDETEEERLERLTAMIWGD